MSLTSLNKGHVFGTIIMASTLASQAQAGMLVGHIIDKNGKSVPDAVIFAMPVEANVPAPPPPLTITVAQETTTFVPYVSVIRRGTKVRFPNHDSYPHHVKSFSPAKTFEFRVDGKQEGTAMKFDTAGEVALTCFFHDSMRGFIYVVDTPYFGKTDKSGNVVVNDVPAGKYDVNVWAPNMIGSPLKQTVQVTADGSNNVKFQFDFIPKPAPKTPSKSSPPPTY